MEECPPPANQLIGRMVREGHSPRAGTSLGLSVTCCFSAAVNCHLTACPHPKQERAGCQLMDFPKDGYGPGSSPVVPSGWKACLCSSPAMGLEKNLHSPAPGVFFYQKKSSGKNECLYAAKVYVPLDPQLYRSRCQNHCRERDRVPVFLC